MKCVVWIRRDLRTDDNTSLIRSLRECDRVFPLNVIDPGIMYREDTSPRRASFYLNALRNLMREIPITVRVGDPAEEVPKFVREVNAETVYYNRDYGFYSSKRDSEVCRRVKCRDFKDHVLVEKGEVPLYMVFTPYYNRWVMVDKPLPQNFPGGNMESKGGDVPELFPGWSVPPSSEEDALRILQEFDDANYSAENPSRISPYLKVGLLSVRRVFHSKSNPSFRRQMAWRDFYFQLYTSDPSYAVLGVRNRHIKWREDDVLFNAWREGKTGFPIIDASMRQLSKTGWMDNRNRLLVSFFLTKVLLIDWRKGALHFMRELLDGEFVVNTGNWQWSAGVGVDQRPLRRFNIIKQSKAIDPWGDYIRRWVEELKGVPNPWIHTPWMMGRSLQEEFGLVMGNDYPYPIADPEKGYQEFVRAFRGSHSEPSPDSRSR